MTSPTLPRPARRPHMHLTSTILAIVIAMNLGATVRAENRWHDRMQGISFIPPAGLVEHAWPDPVTRTTFLDRNGDSISLSIRHRQDVETETEHTPILISPMEEKATDRFHFKIQTDTDELTLDRVEQIALAAMELRDVNCIMLDRADLTPRDVPASALYFKMGEPLFALTEQEKLASAWILGFAFAPVRDDTFAVFQLRADTENFPASRERFEAMVSSLQVDDPALLARRRHEMIQRGDLWVEMLDVEQIRHCLRAVQWYRLQRRNKDIGWVRVQEQETQEMGLPGFGVRTNTHLTSNGRTFDGTEQCFASFDGEYEIWSRRMTVRPASGGADTDTTIATMNETGTRSGDVIQVSRKGPEGVEPFSWRRPHTAYLSQASMRIMRRLLPHKRRTDMAFYAYHPNAVSILLRTAHVEPDETGGFTVITRPGPGHPDDVSTFDGEGTFLRRDMHGEVSLVETTEGELKKLWNLLPR